MEFVIVIWFVIVKHRDKMGFMWAPDMWENVCIRADIKKKHTRPTPKRSFVLMNLLMLTKNTRRNVLMNSTTYDFMAIFVL